MQLPKEYPLAVAVALAMNFQCMSAASGVGKMRKQIFNQLFMQKQFGPQHQRQLGWQIKSGGYPDPGNGVYSQKLSYKDWYRFNVLQRIHMNYVQNICYATTATLAAGLYQPRYAAGVGLLYIVGRALYSIFYQRQKGAHHKLRKLGVALTVLAVLVNTGIFAVNFYKNWGK